MTRVRFAIVAFDGVDELDIVGPLAVLRRAERVNPAFQVKLVTVGPEIEFTTHQGVRMIADELLADHADVFIIPGGGWAAGTLTGARAEIERAILPRHVASMHAQGAVLASVCTGALIVAASGVAKGRRMSTHHIARDELAARGVVVVSDRVFDDGNIISGGGVTSGIDLALYLVERYAGPELSRQIAEALEYPSFNNI